jgi:signal transduction histidine kinase
MLNRIPLPVKLFLIALFPGVFIIYLSVQLYNLESNNITQIQRYLLSANQSERVVDLINEIQNERRLSYLYAIKRSNKADLITQRPRTDAAVKALIKVDSVLFVDFPSYTYLSYLTNIRQNIDSGSLRAPGIMSYYSNLIYRLDAFNDIPSEKIEYIRASYNDLLSQKLLSEMTTLFGMMRWNAFAVIDGAEQHDGIIRRTEEAYQAYKSYEAEFLTKGSPSAIKEYKGILSRSGLGASLAYIAAMESTGTSPVSYTQPQWEQQTTTAVADLRALQGRTLNKGIDDLKHTLNRATARRNSHVILLVLAIVFCLVILILMLNSISKSLKRLNTYANRIARGETGFTVHKVPNDVIGSLARSLMEVDKNDKIIAHTAEAIGKGDFNVTVQPRSDKDLLGNSILLMKNSLESLISSNEELLKKKDDFMSVASHELKAPIAYVKGSLQLIEMKGKKDPNMTEYIPFLRNSIKHVDKLITLTGDLLDVKKIQTGQFKLYKSEFTVRELFAECCDGLQYSCENHRIVMDGDLEVTLNADRQRIEQVVTNFLTNAIKYSPKKDVVNLYSKKVANTLKISVKDYGMGIAPENLPFVFKRFYRTEDAASFTGLGLGLYICTEIIRQHGGEIGVESTVGEGSLFWFTLPLD